MPVTFFAAIKFPLLLQRNYLVSPFVLKGDRLIATKLQTSITYVSLLSYYVVLFASLYILWKEGTVQQNKPKTYLWSVIAIFEFLFTNVSHPVLVIYAERTKEVQILFYNRLKEMDEHILTDFDVSIDYRKFRTTVRCAIASILAYYDVAFVFALVLVYRISSFRSYGLLIFLGTYQIEQLSSGLMSFAYHLSVVLIRERFNVLNDIAVGMQRKVVEKADVEKRCRQICSLLKAFNEMCISVDILNDVHGPMVLIRTAHDFTLATSQCYLICWIFLEQADDFDGQKVSLVVAVVIWLIQNLMKIGLSAALTALTIQKVSISIIIIISIKQIFLSQMNLCAYAINAVNKEDLDDETKMLVSKSINDQINGVYAVQIPL